jgi:hypothetical protein
MHLPSKIYGMGLMTGFALTIAVIALVGVVSPPELVEMAESLQDRTNNIISACVFGVVGVLPLLIEMRRK